MTRSKFARNEYCSTPSTTYGIYPNVKLFCTLWELLRGASRNGLEQTRRLIIWSKLRHHWFKNGILSLTTLSISPPSPTTSFWKWSTRTTTKIRSGSADGADLLSVDSSDAPALTPGLDVPVSWNSSSHEGASNSTVVAMVVACCFVCKRRHDDRRHPETDKHIERYVGVVDDVQGELETHPISPDGAKRPLSQEHEFGR